MPNQDQATTIVPGEIAEQLKQITKVFAAPDAAQQIRDAALGDAALPSTLGLLGKHAWSLKCLTDDVRGLTKVLYGEQRANATLALRHLEDALHRMDRAKALNGPEI